MAKPSTLAETGPVMDWTKDNRIYERYLRWKSHVEDIFSSVLADKSKNEKCGYVRLWMGDEGYPYIEKWKATSELDFSTPEEIQNHANVITTHESSGFKLQTYWDLLNRELKPKSNNILAIIELWTKCRQGNSPLTEWITKVYNVVGNCDYSELGENVRAVKDRMIRDALIIGTNSEKARDKIIREGT